MDILSQFLDMGGYARFIWPAYGLVALVMVLLTVLTIGAARSRSRELASLQNDLGGRRGRTASEGDGTK